MTFCSAQAPVIRSLRFRTDALKLRQPLGLALDYVEDRSSEGLDQFFGKVRADTLDLPDPRYFSMPSTVLGGTTRSSCALNCKPVASVVSSTPPGTRQTPQHLQPPRYRRLPPTPAALVP